MCPSHVLSDDYTICVLIMLPFYHHIEVREHCYGLLLGALEENASSLSLSSSSTPLEAAVAAEHAIFTSVKTAELYKLQTHKKVRKS